jgi:hypothetical protein
MADARTGKRIWPTLLSAAAQAAIRADGERGDSSADTHAAIILARTAFDAYLNELLGLRRLPAYVEFATGPGARKSLSSTRWRLVADGRASLSGLSKSAKKRYQQTSELPLDSKLQTLLLLLEVPHSSTLIVKFETQFGPLKRLNSLRNAIVHHDFTPPSQSLVEICTAVCDALGLPPPDPEEPWENLLRNPSVAVWACLTVCQSIMDLEAIDYNRTIHLSATREAVCSAISPLRYE